MAVTPSAPTCRPSLDEARALAAEHDLVPVVTELLADCDTPVSAFLRLGMAPGSFLLESVEGGERLARYSFLGVSPMASITLDGGVATVVDAAGSVSSEPYTDPLLPVEREVGRYRVAPLQGFAPPFAGGAIGFLSYEAATHFERIPVAPRDPLGVPEGWFAVVDTLIAFDHVSHRMLLLTHARTPPGADVARAYDDAVARLDDLRSRLRSPLPPPAVLFDESMAAEVPPQGERWHSPLQANAGVGEAPHGARQRPDEQTANFSRPDFMRAVERCKEYILAGDIFQVQVGRRFAVPLRAAPFDVYRALRSINPSPYMFFLATPSCDIVGASPEMLVRVTGRHVEYHPIAGTRRRGATPELDAAMERELRESEKERAEHLMLVDLGRNDVGRVCRVGSVKVTEFMEIERYSHVMHMVSSITGELRDDCTAVDALRACFPAGTVTGAPKVRAMEIIAELEPEVRGVYAGTVGYLGFGGNLDTAITLRTLLVKDGVAYAQASGGVVADSTPHEEALEIDNKVAAPLAAVATANRGLDA